MVLSRADLVLVTSQAMALVIADQWRISEGITKVVSWGVSSLFLEQTDPSSIPESHSVRARLGVSPDDLLVVAPRGISRTYRSDELRQAFAAARSGRKDLRLVVLGADAEGATAGDGEVLLPYLPKPELAELFAAADLVVSIPPDDQRSTTVLEAAASGAALVLSDIHPYRELIQLGIEATLVGEPVGPFLCAVLAQAGRMEPEASQRNRSLMRLHEDQQRQMAQVVCLCITED
ncbi:glycosyltransferase [Terrabacter ginsenosidimutans]